MSTGLRSALESAFKSCIPSGKILLVDSKTEYELASIMTHSDLIEMGFIAIQNLDSTNHWDLPYSTIDAVAYVSRFSGNKFETEILVKERMRSITVITNMINFDSSYLLQLARVDADVCQIDRFLEVPGGFSPFSRSTVSANLKLPYSRLKITNLSDDCQLAAEIAHSALNYAIAAGSQYFPNMIPSELQHATMILSTQDPLANSIAQEASTALSRLQVYDSSDENIIIVFMNRLEDIITVIQFPWTYESMIHEYLNVSNGVVIIGNKHYNLNEEDFMLDRLKNKQFGEFCTVAKNFALAFPDQTVPKYSYYAEKHTTIILELLDRMTKNEPLLDCVNLNKSEARAISSPHCHTFTESTKQRVEMLYLNNEKLKNRNINSILRDILSPSYSGLSVHGKERKIIPSNSVIIPYIVGGVSTQDSHFIDDTLSRKFKGVNLIGNTGVNSSYLLDSIRESNDNQNLYMWKANP